VYKLVPGLQETEIKREREFYKSRGLPYPKQIIPGKDAFEFTDEKDGLEAGTKYVGGHGLVALGNKTTDVVKTEHPTATVNYNFHRADEQVNLCLECAEIKLNRLKRKYIRCSSQATITHLKKFVAKKVYFSMDRYKDIDIYCNEELLGKDHTLKFVTITRWRFKDPPLMLQYRPRLDL